MTGFSDAARAAALTAGDQSLHPHGAGGRFTATGGHGDGKTFLGGSSVPTPALRGKTSGVKGDDYIHVHATSNPKKLGSKSHWRFLQYRNGMTVDDYVKAVATEGHDRGTALADLLYDLKKGSISVVDRRLGDRAIAAAGGKIDQGLSDALTKTPDSHVVPNPEPAPAPTPEPAPRPTYPPTGSARLDALRAKFADDDKIHVDEGTSLHTTYGIENGMTVGAYMARSGDPLAHLNTLGSLEKYGKIRIGLHTPSVAASGAPKTATVKTAVIREKVTPTPAVKTQRDGPITRAAYDPADDAALKDYQFGDYANMNARLRSGDSSDPRVSALDAAISKGGLTQDTTLFRGMAGEQPFNFKVGEVRQDAAFTSTSTDKDIAYGFSRDVGLPHSATIKIRAPKGTRAAFFKSYDNFDHNEVLLGRGTRYRITRVSRPDEEGHVEVEGEYV